MTQFEIVSEGYLRDKMGCSFVDQPGQPRRCTFSDGTVIELNMTSSGLGFSLDSPDSTSPYHLCGVQERLEQSLPPPHQRFSILQLGRLLPPRAVW